MKQVLLAINGYSPTKIVFEYSIGLCRRMEAGLNILQFVPKKFLSRYVVSTRRQMGRISRHLEDSFAGAAFAEKGLPRLADEFLPGRTSPLGELIRVDADGIPLKVKITSGNPETGITDYVSIHQDIVLAVFDPSEDRKAHSRDALPMIRKIKSYSGVPLVVVRPFG